MEKGNEVRSLPDEIQIHNSTTLVLGWIHLVICICIFERLALKALILGNFLSRITYMKASNIHNRCTRCTSIAELLATMLERRFPLPLWTVVSRAGSPSVRTPPIGRGSPPVGRRRIWAVSSCIGKVHRNGMPEIMGAGWPVR